MGIQERWLRWRLRGASLEGHLVWVDEQGEPHDLGVYTPGELAGVAWGLDVARRNSPGVGERARLSRYAHAAQRLGAAARRLPKPGA